MFGNQFCPTGTCSVPQGAEEILSMRVEWPRNRGFAFVGLTMSAPSWQSLLLPGRPLPVGY